MEKIKKKTVIEHLDSLIEFYEGIETSDEKLKKLIIISLKDVRRRAESEKKSMGEKLNYRIKKITSGPQYDWVGSEWMESQVVEELEDIRKELLED